MWWMTFAGPAMKPPQAREALRERAHHQIGMDAAVFGGAATVVAEHADTVRFIDHQAGTVLVGQRADVLQRREVAHH